MYTVASAIDWMQTYFTYRLKFFWRNGDTLKPLHGGDLKIETGRQVRRLFLFREAEKPCEALAKQGRQLT